MIYHLLTPSLYPWGYCDGGCCSYCLFPSLWLPRDCFFPHGRGTCFCGPSVEIRWYRCRDGRGVSMEVCQASVSRLANLRQPVYLLGNSRVSIILDSWKLIVKALIWNISLLALDYQSDRLFRATGAVVDSTCVCLRLSHLYSHGVPIRSCSATRFACRMSPTVGSRGIHHRNSLR